MTSSSSFITFLFTFTVPPLSAHTLHHVNHREPNCSRNHLSELAQITTNRLLNTFLLRFFTVRVTEGLGPLHDVMMKTRVSRRYTDWRSPGALRVQGCCSPLPSPPVRGTLTRSRQRPRLPTWPTAPWRSSPSSTSLSLSISLV